MARYALYYTPASSSALARAGNTWLGRSPHEAADPDVITSAPPGIDTGWLRQLTTSPRRYGFHATLKAPMDLANGVDPDTFIKKVKAWAASRRPAHVRLRCAQLGRFIALRPTDDESSAVLRSLADSCVREFDPYRAELTKAEIKRRLDSGIDTEQTALLHRWGYPYVFEQYRFHMTLSNTIADHTERQRLFDLAQHWFAPILADPLTINSIAVFEEATPGSAFVVRAVAPFAKARG